MDELPELDRKALPDGTSAVVLLDPGTGWTRERNLVRTYPDLVWSDEAGRPRAVVDAKYKAQKYDSFPDADLYQALAYATALGLDAAHLVYAKGSEPARHYVVRHCGVRLVAHVLDLNLPPASLLQEVARLADRVRAASSTASALAGGLSDQRHPSGRSDSARWSAV